MIRFQTWIEEEKYEELKELAEQKSMAVSEYVRELLNKTAPVDLSINFSDIDHLVDEVEDIKHKIDSVLPTIFRTGKIYEQEAALLKQILNSIDSKCDDIWKYIVLMRGTMYDEVRGKLYKEVTGNSYVRRRSKKELDKMEEKKHE